MRYSTLMSSDTSLHKALENLDLSVNKSILMGYKPIGGVSIHDKGGYFYASQAVFKEVEEEL
jgi:hypothetical protein